MNLEYVRWKKFEKLMNKQDGWINKNKLDFNTNYQEIITCGINVSENKEWLTVAYSLCKDEYFCPIQIYKPNIIERKTYNTEEVVEQRSLELTKEQKEYAKKDMEILHILDRKEEPYDKNGQPNPPKYIELNGKPFNIFCLHPCLKDYNTYRITQFLNNFVRDYEKYTQKELFKIYPASPLEIVQIINILIENNIIEKHGKHWREEKGLITRNTSGKVYGNKLTKEQEQFIIDNYEKYTQVEFAEYFNVKKSVITDKILKLVKKGIVPKHERGWTRYSKEYQEFRNIIPKEKEKTKQFIITEEQQNTLIKYYNMGIKATDLANQINLPIAKVYEIIRSLVSEGKIVPRVFYLGHYIYYTSQEELEEKKQEINEQLSSKQKTDIKEVEETKKKLQLSTKQIKTLLKKEKITGNENTDLIYTIPTSLGGILKLDPPINKKEFIEDSKILDVKELVKKYGKPVFVIESLLKDLNKPRTIKFLLDKNTSYKWVFKTPLVIDEYLKDKDTLSFEELRSKYKLSPKVFKMLDSFISRV